MIVEIAGAVVTLFTLLKKKPYRLWIWYNDRWNDHGTGSAKRLKAYAKTQDNEWCLTPIGSKPAPKGK